MSVIARASANTSAAATTTTTTSAASAKTKEISVSMASTRASDKHSDKKQDAEDDDEDVIAAASVLGHIKQDVTAAPVSAKEKQQKKLVGSHPSIPSMDLRHQATIQSAQQKLMNMKDISKLNISIESRKKLTMLIKFLKLGNDQLSERIDKLIDSIDEHVQKHQNRQASDSSSSHSHNNLEITSLTNDIVTTVKKIVNVVSKLPAQSFSEPARDKIREALLRLPANWSNNELHFITGNDDTDDADADADADDADSISSSSSSDDAEYEDSRESFEPNENSSIPVIRVTNKQLFQKVRRPSITRRLMNSLMEYRKGKSRKLSKSHHKMKKWFKRKIKGQLLNESNGRVLILAQESLDMVSNIIRTCSESLDKAEEWNVGKQLIQQRALNQLTAVTEEAEVDGDGDEPAADGRRLRDATPEIVIRDR